MTVDEVNSQLVGHDPTATKILREGRWHRLEAYRPPKGANAGHLHIGLVHDTIYETDAAGRSVQRPATDAEVIASFLRDAPASFRKGKG